ncbi:MAG: hypothetical protein OXH50_11775 [Gemmatimonadetes bacterium]|nr:hypothetical protein [Gemmatimonadota bacterium]
MKRLFCTATAALLAVADADAVEEKPLPQSAGQVRPVLVGAALPPAVLTGDDEVSLDLGAAVAEKPAVLVFYRGGW